MKQKTENSSYIYDYPLYYEIGFCDDSVTKQVQFMLRCFRTHSGAPKPLKILDNGCGTGVYLETFVRAGFQVSGYDLSPQMVKFASERLKRITNQAHIFTADLRDFKTRDKYDLAFCTNGSFQHLYSVSDVASHLQCVSQSLKDNGLYIVHLPAPEVLLASPPGTIQSQWSSTRDGIRVDVDFTFRQSSIEWSTQTFSGLAKINVNDHGKRFNLRMPYRYRFFFPLEFEALVKASGCLEIVDFYGDFHLARRYATMHNPKHLIVVLRKTT